MLAQHEKDFYIIQQYYNLDHFANTFNNNSLNVYKSSWLIREINTQFFIFFNQVGNTVHIMLLLFLFFVFCFSSCLLFYMVDKVDNIQRWVASQEEKLSVGGGSVGGAPLELSFFFFLLFYFLFSLFLYSIFSVCVAVCVCMCVGFFSIKSDQSSSPSSSPCSNRVAAAVSSCCCCCCWWSCSQAARFSLCFS